jgi:hypothetical protein
MPPLASFTIHVALLVATAAAVRAQEWQRFVKDLGVPDRTETAERALLELGPRAVDALTAALAEPVATDADRDRVRAVARVTTLLGEAAAAFAPTMDAILDQPLRGAANDVIDALASLAPYGKGREWHEHFHKHIHESVDPAGAYVAYCRFATRSNQQPPADFAAAKAILTADRLFERELAAEAFLHLRDPACLEPLRDRLVARDRLPEGHDGLRHNGYIVPMRDRFALRAAQAMVAIAPTDPNCAIAWAVLAVEHPHATFRLSALRTLAGFGPDAACAAPELVELATGNDAVVAAEALKVLGMAGDAAAPHAARLLPLADRDGNVGKLAKGLCNRLRATGAIDERVVAHDPQAAASARATMLAAAKALDRSDTAADAERTLRATPDLAFVVLSQRLREERSGVPDRALRLLAELATARSVGERETLRFALANLGSENWSGPMMSSSSGGDRDGFRVVHAELHGRLELDTTAIPDLVAAVTGERAMQRLAAARLLAAQADAIAAATDTASAWRTTLVQAAAKPPAPTLEMHEHPNSSTSRECDLGPALRAAVAIALRACDLPPDTAKAMFAAALTSDDDPERIAVAVRRFGPAADAAALTKAAADPRPAVAAAARDVQASRSQTK